MNNKVIIAILITIVVGLSAFYVQMRKGRPRLSSMPIGGDFSIPATNGTFNLKDYRGKVVLLYFGFTFCPDICPTTLATLGALLKDLPQKHKKQVESLFISVDPQRDDLNKLREYVEFFYPKMIGATDTSEKVQKLAKKYGVTYQKYYPTEGDAYYTVDHSTQAFIINQDGEVAELILHGESVEKITKKLNKYLKEEK